METNRTSIKKRYDLGNIKIVKGGVGSGRPPREVARALPSQELPVLSINEEGRVSGQGIRRVPGGVRETAEYIGTRAGLGAAEAAIEGAVGTLVNTTLNYLDIKREKELQRKLKVKAGIKPHKTKPLTAEEKLDITSKIVGDTLDYTLDAGIAGAIGGTIRGINEKLATDPRTAPFRLDVKPDVLARAINTAKIHILRQERPIANTLVMQYPGKNIKQKELRMRRDDPDGYRYYRVLTNMANLRDRAEAEKEKRKQTGGGWFSRLKAKFRKMDEEDAKMFAKAFVTRDVKDLELVREDLLTKVPKKKKRVKDIRKRMGRKELITNCVDLFGYSEDDFEDKNYKEILNYLTKEQREKIKQYGGK